MRKAHKLTVEIVAISDTESEATDGVGEMLRLVEERLTGGWILDWRFISDNPEPVTVPDSTEYGEGDVFTYPHDLVRYSQCLLGYYEAYRDGTPVGPTEKRDIEEARKVIARYS